MVIEFVPLPLTASLDASIVTAVESSAYFLIRIFPVCLVTDLLRPITKFALGLTDVAPFAGLSDVIAGTSAVTIEMFCATTVGKSPSAPNSTTYPCSALHGKSFQFPPWDAYIYPQSSPEP